MAGQAAPKIVHSWGSGTARYRVIDTCTPHPNDREIVLEQVDGADAMGVDRWRKLLEVGIERFRSGGRVEGSDVDAVLPSLLLLEVYELKRKGPAS